MKRRAFLALVLATTPATAHSYKAGQIFIGHAWALPATISDGQVFFPLLNRGEMADRLVAARSAVAAIIELRENNRYDQPPLQGFDLAPGKPFPMRPTSHHLRLIGLRQPFVVGDAFPLILDFDHAGELEVLVHVAHSPAE